MTEIDKQAVAKACAGWAPVYDLVFGPVFTTARNASIGAGERIGGRILDAGVGTGLSLTAYSPHNRIVGIDYCGPMLRKAQQRVALHDLAHIETLAVMDAQQLGFRDGFFDVVVAQFVITAVPDPEATLDEFVRVTRPGGEIVLVNHLGAEAGLQCDLEHLVAPLARGLGRRPEFKCARIAQCAECRGRVRVLERRAVTPLGQFSLIRLGRIPEPGQNAPRRGGLR